MIASSTSRDSNPHPSNAHQITGRTAGTISAGRKATFSGEGLVILLTALFFAVLVIGTNPFSGGNSISIDKSGEGDTLRQVLIIILYTLSLPLVLVRRKAVLRLLRNNHLVTAIFLWSLVSVFWSSVPDIAIRRELGTILCACLCLLAATIKPSNYANLLLLFTGLIMLIDCTGVVALRSLSIDHSGFWVGLHTQKNVAGYFSAVASLVWLLAGLIRKRKLMIIISGLWMIFLLKTGSKTSTAILIPSILISLYINRGLRKSFYITDIVIIASTVLIFSAAVSLYLFSMPQIDPTQISFTGRTRIWAFVWENALQAPLLGVGYGSFWAIGDNAPALQRASPFVAQYTEAHNGYLDVLVSLGAVGLVLIVLALGKPFWSLFRRKSTRYSQMQSEALIMPMAILIFAILHNFLESSILQGLNWLWAITLIAAWQGSLQFRRQGA
jgi:O-antigen ligase